MIFEIDKDFLPYYNRGNLTVCDKLRIREIQTI